MAHEDNQLLQLSSSDTSLEETKSVSSHSVNIQSHGTDENVVISDAETENFSIQAESMRTSDMETGSQYPNSVYTQTISTDESTGTSDIETEDVATPSVNTQPHAAVYHHSENKILGTDLKTKLEGKLKEQISIMVPNYENRNAIKSDSETEGSSSELDSLFLSEASEIDEECHGSREISIEVSQKFRNCKLADYVNKSDELCENLCKDTKHLSIYLHSNEAFSDVDKQLGVVHNFNQSCKKLKETEQPSGCRDSSISPHEPSSGAIIASEKEIKQIYSLDENRVIEVVVDKGTQSCKNFETREHNLHIHNASLPLKKIINKRYKQLGTVNNGIQSCENLEITEHTPDVENASLLVEEEIKGACSFTNNKQFGVNRTESCENFETSEHSPALQDISLRPRKTTIKETCSLGDNKQYLRGANNGTLSFENFETSEQSSELQDKSIISEKNINEILSLSDNEQLPANNGNQLRENSETSEHSRSLRSTSRSPRCTGAIKKIKKKKVKETYSHVRFVRTSPGNNLYLKFKYIEENYICEICNKQFKSFSKIKNHLHRNERVNMFPCNFCKKNYSSAKWLERHLAKCRPNLSCQNCRVEFTSLENKKKHTCVKETVKELSCDEEGFRIPSQIHFEGVSVDYEDPDVCRNDVHTNGYGREHSEDHEKIYEDASKTVVRDECRGYLETKNNCSVTLKDEEKVNMGILPPTDSTKLVNSQYNRLYTCDDCSECFKNPVLLKMHSCSHRFEQIYVCDECGEEFDEREEIILHIRSHAGDKS